MKFKIEEKKEKKVNKCIRFSEDLVDRINNELKDCDVCFSEFVIQACIYALENIDKK